MSEGARDGKVKFAWRVRLAVYGVLLGMLFVFLGYCTWMPGESASRFAVEAVDHDVATKLRMTVSDLVEIGPRNLDYPQGYRRAQAYLEGRLEGGVGRQLFREQVVSAQGDAWNLYVQWGEPKRDELVVVGAHYDTAFDTPGGNDNGSGVALALHLVEVFEGKPPRGALRLVLFSNEEAPHFWKDSMGSLVHARGCRARGERIKAMISLETLGFYSEADNSQRYPPAFDLLYPHTGEFVAFVGNLKSRALISRALDTFRRAVEFPSEGGAFPGGLPGIGWSDHWSFWQEGYPAIMVTDTAPFRDSHYHQLSDRGEQIDYERLSVVAHGMEAVIRRLADNS